MKLTMMCCSCLLGLAALAGAQDKMDKPMDMKKEVKVTGCVAAGTEADHFMLNNAMMAGDMKKEGAPMSYTLMGGALKPHVGHKVEVTGMWDDKKPMMHTDKPAPAGEMAKPMAGMHALKVKSVKMIADTCGS